ncbi:unnamed protein product, partial [Prorocentrum cordatum]
VPDHDLSDTSTIRISIEEFVRCELENSGDPSGDCVPTVEGFPAHVTHVRSMRNEFSM